MSSSSYYSSSHSSDIDDDLVCPITQRRFKNPVIASDGITYEKSAIKKWMEKQKTSPMRLPGLLTDELIPNVEIIQKLQHKKEKRTKRKKAAMRITRQAIKTTQKSNDVLSSKINELIRHIEYLEKVIRKEPRLSSSSIQITLLDDYIQSQDFLRDIAVDSTGHFCLNFINQNDNTLRGAGRSLNWYSMNEDKYQDIEINTDQIKSMLDGVRDPIKFIRLVLKLVRKITNTFQKGAADKFVIQIQPKFYFFRFDRDFYFSKIPKIIEKL